MKNPTPKTIYRITNWHDYNNSLKARGSLEIWISADAQAAWYAEPAGLRSPGRQRKYADAAILTVLTLGKVFHQPLRQAQGLADSCFRLLGAPLDVPDYTTLSRRGEVLPVLLPKEDKEGVILVVDSTGLKVFGEGEWKVRQHGCSKRRTWKKLHLAFDLDGEVRAAELTGNDCTDAEVIGGGLLNAETARIDACAGDGAYDQRQVYDDLRKRAVPAILIPPQHNAKIWQHGNNKGPPHPRDQNLRAIRQSSRKQWKQQSGYHIRSLAETGMYRLKTVFGDRLSARKEGTQKTEALLMCAALNTITHLGMPAGRWVTE